VRTTIFPVCYGAGLRRCHAEADLSGAGSRSYPGCLKAPDRSLMNARESERFCPSSPQPPSPLVGEGGSLRVLKPKTRGGTQVSQKPLPVRPHTPGIPRSLAGAAARRPFVVRRISRPPNRFIVPTCCIARCARFWQCSTLSNKTNPGENCYTCSISICSGENLPPSRRFRSPPPVILADATTSRSDTAGGRRVADSGA